MIQDTSRSSDSTSLYEDAEGKLVMTFDNKESLKRKAEYVNRLGLGGIMFWDAGGDTSGHELMKTLKKHLK